jgi:rhodanese-related sulfurtransferase
MSALREWVREMIARRRSARALSAAALAEWLAAERPVQILDLRPEAAFEQEHIPGARPLAMDRLEEELADLDRGCATVVY